MFMFNFVFASLSFALICCFIFVRFFAFHFVLSFVTVLISLASILPWLRCVRELRCEDDNRREMSVLQGRSIKLIVEIFLFAWYNGSLFPQITSQHMSINVWNGYMLIHPLFGGWGSWLCCFLLGVTNMNRIIHVYNRWAILVREN